MVEIDDYANGKIFNTVERYIVRTRSYGSPPIHYWYRNVVESVKLIDNGFDIREGSYRQQLEKSLGDVYYDVRYIGNDAVYIVTDFDFNYRTIRSYLNRAKNTRPPQTTRPVAPLYSNPSKQVISSYSIGHKIECCQFKDGTIRLQYKGRNIPLKSQFDKILSPFRRHKDGEYAIGEKNGVKYKLFANDTTQAITESLYRQVILEDNIHNKNIEIKMMKTNKKVVRLTESDLHNIITESVSQILNELDPRTYASAADEAKRRKEYGRMSKFRKGAVDAWNRYYAEPHNKFQDSLPKRGLRNNVRMDDTISGYGINTKLNRFIDGDLKNTFDTDIEFTPDKTYEWDSDGNEFVYDDYYPDVNVTRTANHLPTEVARQMARGDGKYIKGKGWQ